MSPQLLPTLLAVLLFSHAAAAATEPVHRTVRDERDIYSAWPSIVRAANGDLLLSFTEKEQHLSPDGTAVIMRSTDHGRTWSGPEPVVDTILDDGGSGLTVLPDGGVVMHTMSRRAKPSYYESLDSSAYPQAWVQRWAAKVRDPAMLAAETGFFQYLSQDHGHTWEKAGPGPDSVHGGIALQDGSLLVTSYYDIKHSALIYRADDIRSEWELVHTVASPAMPHLRFGEPHAAQMPDGRIVVLMRATANPYDDRRGDLYMWQVYSDDNGQTWSVPHPTPMLGFPPHLLTLEDGRLLCTYGRRTAPFGHRAMISEDGITWNPAEEIILNDDAPNHDLGYPASVELGDGRILTAYYQKPAWNQNDKHDHKVAIFTVEWELPQPELHPSSS